MQLAIEANRILQMILYSLQAAEEKVTFNLRVLVTVAAVYGILAKRCGKLLSNSSFIGFGRVGGANQGSEIGHRISLFQNGGNDNAAAHELR